MVYTCYYFFELCNVCLMYVTDKDDCFVCAAVFLYPGQFFVEGDNKNNFKDL